MSNLFPNIKEVGIQSDINLFVTKIKIRKEVKYSRMLTTWCKGALREDSHNKDLLCAFGGLKKRKREKKVGHVFVRETAG